MTNTLSRRHDTHSLNTDTGTCPGGRWVFKLSHQTLSSHRESKHHLLFSSLSLTPWFAWWALVTAKRELQNGKGCNETSGLAGCIWIGVQGWQDLKLRSLSNYFLTLTVMLVAVSSAWCSKGSKQWSGRLPAASTRSPSPPCLLKQHRTSTQAPSHACRLLQNAGVWCVF